MNWKGPDWLLFALIVFTMDPIAELIDSRMGFITFGIPLMFGIAYDK